jgi:hypothetical protein
MRRLVIVAALLIAGCGSGNPPTAPVLTLAGSWSGSLESSNFAAVSVTAELSQSGTAVTGTWRTSAGTWSGNINGSNNTASFSGVFAITATGASGGTCAGTANVSGPAPESAQSLTWSSPGFTGNCDGMPMTLTWKLQRR